MQSTHCWKSFLGKFLVRASSCFDAFEASACKQIANCGGTGESEWVSGFASFFGNLDLFKANSSYCNFICVVGIGECLHHYFTLVFYANSVGNSNICVGCEWKTENYPGEQWMFENENYKEPWAWCSSRIWRLQNEPKNFWLRKKVVLNIVGINGLCLTTVSVWEEESSSKGN